MYLKYMTSFSDSLGSRNKFSLVSCIVTGRPEEKQQNKIPSSPFLEAKG
jgi:hypothetical protein